MGRYWGILALAIALATAALLTHQARERRQAERAALLWQYVLHLDNERLATEAADHDSGPAALSASATPTASAAADSSTAAASAAALPVLLAVDPRSGLAVLRSADALTHILATNQSLPFSPWRLTDIGPDFVELDGNIDGKRQRLRLYRQDLQRPYRLISDRVETPTVERMILLPLQPITDDTTPATETAPPGTAGVPPAGHAMPPGPDSGARP